MANSIRVLDLVNTSESAKELLFNRALKLRNKFNVENDILCSSGPYVEQMRDAGVTVHVLDTPRTLRPLALARSYARLVRLLRRQRYAIVHSHGSVLGLLTRLSRPFIHARIVHTVHGFHFHEHMSPGTYALYSSAERLQATLTDLLLSQNYEDLDVLRKWRLRSRVEWIGNGIPLPRQVDSYRAEAKSEYVLCNIARFESVKDHRTLFKGFAAILERGVRARLLCFGGGELFDDMKAYVRDLGVEDHVEFRGYVPDVSAHLAGVDLHILTSLKEGLPRAIIETMAMGIPPVATNVKGTREVVEDGITGRLVPLKNPAALADAAVQLLRDPVQRQRMSEACVTVAREKYSESAVCDRLARLYASLLGTESVDGGVRK